MSGSQSFSHTYCSVHRQKIKNSCHNSFEYHFTDFFNGFSNPKFDQQKNRVIVEERGERGNLEVNGLTKFSLTHEIHLKVFHTILYICRNTHYQEIYVVV